ncbi:hypothetical protein ACF0H5_009247 [Mactra antiquata]
MGGLSIILANFVLLAVFQSVALEEKICSRFHYEEQTLYKIITLETRIEDLEDEIKELKLFRDLDDTKVSLNTCDDEWVTFQSKCYLFGTFDLDFKAAEDFCKRQGGHLVSIRSGDEIKFIRRSVMELNAKKFWIGLTDEAVEGVWRWIDNDEIADVVDWYHTQPNQGRVSNCGAIWESRNNQWVDEPCSGYLFRPICKK